PEGGALPGEAAFRLYDTYGFPLDLTQDALREKGRAVDVEGFDAAMQDQKSKARASWAGSGETRDAAIWFDLSQAQGPTEFLGYDTETAEGEIRALVRDGSGIGGAAQGETVQIVVNQTPFYAESGGQVGDAGEIRTDTGTARITDTRKSAGIFIHVAQVTDGTILKGQPAKLEVDHHRRSRIRANHSATHLLNEALREALGDHVAQRGSQNPPHRLRFYFSQYTALSPAELARVEADVNAYIRQNGAVDTRIMTPDDARAIGAQALFGEKYGDEVRVVSMGRALGSAKGFDGNAWSVELCGGTHVGRLGEIGLCVLLGDSASSAGVRRIEALTGAAALAHLSDQVKRLAEVATVLKAQPDVLLDRVKALVEERRALQNEVAQLRREAAMGGAGPTGPAAKDIGGIRFLSQVVSGVSGRDLPGLI
ncbi:MAG: alanine--tRNA ligase-related protein, partial [Rhodobacterales bacterium]